MSELRDKFPPMPPCRGVWLPIYIEPIMGSGERITIIIAAVAKVEGKAIRAISTDTAMRLYGHKALSDQIELILVSVQEFLKKNQNIEAWKPPLSGVFIGRLRDAASNDIDGIINQGLTMSASLYSK